MDLSKLLNSPDALGSNSTLSRSTSLLQTLSIREPPSAMSTALEKEKDDLKQLMDKVSNQDRYLKVINKCTEESCCLLDPGLKSKIKKIMQYHSFKKSCKDNGINEALFYNKEFLGTVEDGDLKLSDKESQELNKAIQKCIDAIYDQTKPEQRFSSSKSSAERIVELQDKIHAKYSAVLSVADSIDKLQNQIIHVQTVEYRDNVLEPNAADGELLKQQIEKLHDNAVVLLAQSIPGSSQDPSSTGRSSLKDSVVSMELEVEELETKRANYRKMEATPEGRAVMKKIRKLQKQIQEKTFVLQAMQHN